MRKPLVIFYALAIYVLSEILWWAYLLVSVQPERKGMILGEGSIFLLVFITGAYYLQKNLKKGKKTSRATKELFAIGNARVKVAISVIKLYLQTILKRDLDKEQINGFLKNSLKDIERLDDLVENMLLATRIENHSYSFPKEEFDFSELVAKVASRLQIHSCRSQIINCEVEPGVKLRGDKFALTLVVSNLVENAVKYSPACAEVKVKLSNKNNNVQFAVEDKGIGISDEEKLRIFDKFYRVGSEDTRKTKGTGLGLYIVKQVLEKHKAYIKVKNNKPAGTIFEVTFNTHGN